MSVSFVTFEKREIRRGDLWYIEFPALKDGVKGGQEIPEDSLQRGLRPGLIVQSNKGSHSNIILVAPVSAARRSDYPFMQRIKLRKNSVVHYEQITPIPRKSFVNYIRALTPSEEREMELRMAVALGSESLNLLHYENLKVISKSYDPSVSDYVYQVSVERVFGYEQISVTEKQLYDKFPDLRGEANFSFIESRLDSIRGLKFLQEMAWL